MYYYKEIYIKHEEGAGNTIHILALLLRVNIILDYHFSFYYFNSYLELRIGIC